MWKNVKHYGGEALMWIAIAVGLVAVVALVLGLIAGVFSLAVGLAVGLAILKGVVPGIVLWLFWSFFDLAKEIPGVQPQFYDIALWKFILGCAAISTIVRMITGRKLGVPRFKKRGEAKVVPAT